MPEYSKNEIAGFTYWTLVIEIGWVQASIWTIEELDEGKKVKVISDSPPIAWELEGDLIGATDTALSDCIQSFPEDQKEPSKTVFGVAASWVTDGSIKPEYLEKIKIICSKLSLEPAGFVVLPEAIAYFIKSDEGSPLTGVVIGLGKENLDVSLFNLGNLVGSVSVSRSVSLVDDVIEGLARFPQDGYMPSRFLIMDGKSGELDIAHDTLSQADWMGLPAQRIKFLHTPKIELIDPRKKITAVSLAGASEIAGISVIGVEIFEKEEPRNSEDQSYSEEVSNVETQTVDPRELGFALGHDLAGDFLEKQEMVSKAESKETHTLEDGSPLSEFFSKIKSKLLKFSFKKPAIMSSLPSLGGLPKYRINKLADSAFLFKAGTVFLILAFTSLAIAWWFLPKAEIVIYVSPKTLSKKETITIDTKGKENLEEKILSGKVFERKVNGELTSETTGKKTVGERAKGKVQIRNGTAGSVKLPSGSVLLTNSNLKFTLDSSASVSAATTPTTPGTAILDVTAGDIGSDYNIAKGEVFKVSNYPKSEVDAVSETAFSGGASREIRAVSENDQESLEEKITEKLLNEGRETINLNISPGDILIEDAVALNISQKDFNHKVGDEAGEIKLALTADLSAPIISKEKLAEFTRGIFDGDIPEGYVLRNDQIKNEFELIGVENGIWEVKLISTVNLLPVVNVDEIAGKIKGKYPEVAREFLASIPGFLRAEVKLTPSLPGKLGIIPRVSKNISIEISSERQ